MKKLLALTLSLLMVFSCMTCLFTGTASAETTAPENITWTPARSIKISTTEADGTAIVPYQNGPAYRMTSYPRNQSIYTTATLEANTTYTFTAYFKGNYIPTVGYNSSGTATDGKGETWVISTKAGFDDCHMNDGSVVSTDWFEYYDDDGYENLYKQDAYRDAYTDNDTWRKYSFSFKTGDDTEYYIVLGLDEAYSGGDTDPRTMYMSDVTLEKRILGDWTPARSIKISTTEADGTAIVPYQNGPAYRMTSYPRNQSIYTTATLEANTTYTFTAYFKGNYIPTVGYNAGGTATDGKGETWVISTKAGFDDCHMNDGSVVSTGWFEYYDDDGYENLYKQDAYRDAYTDNDTWRKYSFSFKTGDDTEYYIVLGLDEAYSGGDTDPRTMYMSDVVVEKVIGVSATAEGNGTAKVDKSIASSGETVTFTAATAGGSTFLGWYDGENKVSDNLVYTTVVTDDISLTAKFEGGATAVDGWYSPRGGAGWITTTTDIASVAGGTVYKTGSWPVDRSIYTTLTLKPGTTYTFSAYFMGAVAAALRNNADPDYPTLYQDGKGNESWIISANADITKGSAGGDTGISDWNEFTGNGTYANLNKGDGSLDARDAENKFTTWRKYEVTFTTEEDTEYYIILGLEGDSSEQANYPNYMSDASIIEVGDAVPEVTEFTENLGSSLRKESESTYGQAIRHKFTFEKEVLTANYGGYKVVEIGFATALTEALEGHASIPVLNATSYKVLNGVAYQASYDGNVSKNIVFEENDTTVTYTAALYNISDYAKSYTVVPYVVFANADGNRVTRYGEAQAACIFDVAKAILDGNNSDDIAYVNGTLLAGDYKAQYDAWLAE